MLMSDSPSLLMNSAYSACTASSRTRKIYYRTNSRYGFPQIVTSTCSCAADTNTTSQQERKYFDSGDYALSKAGKASDTGVTTIGTEHPNAENIPHASPLTHIVTRSDSIPSASPPSNPLSPSLSNLNNNPLAGVGSGEAASPTLSGPSPAGMHRGSINGIPGANVPGSMGILNSRSPAKESYLNRSASIDEAGDDDGTNRMEEDGEEGEEQQGESVQRVSSPLKTEGIPIRR